VLMKMLSWFVRCSAVIGLATVATAAFVPAAQACSQAINCKCSGIPSTDIEDATVARARVAAEAGGNLQLDVIEHIAGPKGAAVGGSIRVTPTGPDDLCGEEVALSVGDEVLVAYEAEVMALELDDDSGTADDAGTEPPVAATHHGRALVRPWDALPFAHGEAKYLVDTYQCDGHFSGTHITTGCSGSPHTEDDDGGCAVAAPGRDAGSSAWWFVAAAALWLTRRRTSR
jgi:MYXO-CTERM domain-containing protein